MSLEPFRGIFFYVLHPNSFQVNYNASEKHQNQNLLDVGNEIWKIFAAPNLQSFNTNYWRLRISFLPGKAPGHSV